MDGTGENRIAEEEGRENERKELSRWEERKKRQRGVFFTNMFLIIHFLHCENLLDDVNSFKNSHNVFHLIFIHLFIYYLFIYFLYFTFSGFEQDRCHLKSTF